MSVGPFCVGLVVSTVNVAFLLRHIKYRTELCTYGYLEGNRPFSSKTPFTDSKDYRLVSVEDKRRNFIHLDTYDSLSGNVASYSPRRELDSRGSC
jgi:hypothetical protein